MSLPENITNTLSTIENNGFCAYVVGGCVRDCLLGNPPIDFDICTNALPSDIIRIFDKTAPTGIKHGTVTVITENFPIEVTTFRTDGSYGDFRHPENVEFVNDLKTDLSRRDFTVNAMCYSKKDGLIDYFGGIEDLKNKTLRAVRDPDKRFKEDALRILRLFRFSSTLGFNIENKTYNAALKNASLLKNISAERIRAELEKLSCGICPEAILPLLQSENLSPLKADKRVSKIHLLPESPCLRFFSFLRLTSDDLSTALNFLKCSNSFKDYARKLDTALGLPYKTKPDMKRLLSLLEDNIFDMFDYKSCVCGCNTDSAKAKTEEIIKHQEPYKISQLDISGEDIIKKGYCGKNVGKKLEMLLSVVIEHPDINDRDKLLKLI
ncbi:MAG: CCA tRNA nucleotidyltransferase [Clostridia bacterium]|nr:CCA tRNA nucleotidyltransferase [Clostridia bacterium]